MGGWKLEVAKMAMYLSFPVVLFYYFNRPELYEKYVVETRRQVFPPDSKTHDKELQDVIKELRRKEQIEMLKALEQATEKQ